MDEITISEMKGKQIYRIIDIKTSNPRRLFRSLRNALEEWEYEVNLDSVDVKKDEVGNSGYVSADLAAEREILRQEEGKGGYTLDFTGASKLKKYCLLGGVVIFVVGLIAKSAAITVAGVIILCIALFFMLKRKAGLVSYLVELWIKGNGEIYRAQLSELMGETQMEREKEREQIVSELSVRIAAQSTPPTELNELHSHIEQLVGSLESSNE